MLGAISDGVQPTEPYLSGLIVVLKRFLFLVIDLFYSACKTRFILS